MLRLESVDAGYGYSRVLHQVDLDMKDDGIVALLGRNGVGKTTTLNAIMGLVSVTRGAIFFDGHELTKLAPYRIPRLGLALVPQGRHVFAELTTEENLTIGILKGPAPADVLEWVFRLFPVLQERHGQLAGSLSGGEQQMLAIGRALMMRPRLVLMDEPLEGLSPIMARVVNNAIREVRKAGVGILIVDQNVDNAIELADRVNIMEKGQIKVQCSPNELKANPDILEQYLGVRRH